MRFQRCKLRRVACVTFLTFIRLYVVIKRFYKIPFTLCGIDEAFCKQQLKRALHRVHTYTQIRSQTALSGKARVRRKHAVRNVAADTVV